MVWAGEGTVSQAPCERARLGEQPDVGALGSILARIAAPPGLQRVHLRLRHALPGPLGLSGADEALLEFHNHLSLGHLATVYLAG